MTIWFSDPDLALLNRKGASCANGNLGIEMTEAGDDYLKGRMPVDERTRQPAGVLHGGASVLFAETLASWGASMVVDPSRHHCVGLEINANHVRAAAEGFVTGVATLAHQGSTVQVWDVRISNDVGKLVCVCRVTIAVLAKPTEY